MPKQGPNGATVNKVEVVTAANAAALETALDALIAAYESAAMPYQFGFISITAVPSTDALVATVPVTYTNAELTLA